MLRTAPILSAILLACAANSQSATGGCGQEQLSLSPADTTVYDEREVTTKPLPIDAQALHYPDEARQQGIQGGVRLTMIINSDGTVDKNSVRVLQVAHYLLEREAIRYTQASRFQPACLNGRAVRVRFSWRVDFKISQ